MPVDRRCVLRSIQILRKPRGDSASRRPGQAAIASPRLPSKTCPYYGPSRSRKILPGEEQAHHRGYRFRWNRKGRGEGAQPFWPFFFCQSTIVCAVQCAGCARVHVRDGGCGCEKCGVGTVRAKRVFNLLLFRKKKGDIFGSFSGCYPVDTI